jgi:hypothetical protein
VIDDPIDSLVVSNKGDDLFGWQTFTVKLFAQMKGSRHVLLGEWIVSRKIDFKEDQPVQLKEIKKEPEKKK